MKNDETSRHDAAFEQRLRQQSVKKLPPGWREEILTAAQQAEVSRHPSPATRHSLLARFIQQLSTLSRPHRAAWAGLATVWVVIMALNFSERDNAPMVARQVTPPSPEALAAWHAQRRELAALAGLNPPREVEAPKNRPPQPRSNRRDEAVAV